MDSDRKAAEEGAAHEAPQGSVQSPPVAALRASLNVAAVMLAGMTAFEATKEWLGPGLTKWESHVVTIVFASVVAAVAAYFVGRSLEARHRTLREAIRQKNVIESQQQQTIAELRGAMSQLRELRGMLPICSYCKKIRDDEGYWSSVEKYISARSDATFTHGICPDCAREHYPDVFGAPGEDGGSPAKPPRS